MTNVIALDDHRTAQTRRDRSRCGDAASAGATVIDFNAHRSARHQNRQSEGADVDTPERLKEFVRLLVEREMLKESSRQFRECTEILKECNKANETVIGFCKLVRQLAVEVDELKRRGKRGPRPQK